MPVTKEKVSEYSHKYYQVNRTEILDKRRSSYAKNKDRINVKRRLKYANDLDHRSKVVLSQKKYRKKVKENLIYRKITGQSI